MATVYVGSARINEKHGTSGGAPGDQTKGEVAKQAAYVHEKGWVILEAKDSRLLPFIAQGMRSACDNNNIGYDGPNRLALYNLVKALGFDPAKASKPTQCDCSSLVRVCILFALAKLGIKKSIPNFRTINEPAYLVSTGLFNKITDPRITRNPQRWKAGFILCTPESGHTVIVCNDGDLAYVPLPDDDTAPFSLINVPYLKYGSTGDAVAYMQMLLAKQGAKYALPKSKEPGARFGYDGIWKTTIKLLCETERVFRQWQKDVFPGQPDEWDGVCGPHCWSKLTGLQCK